MNELGYYALLVADTGRANELSFKLIKKRFGGPKEQELIPWTSIEIPVSGFRRGVDHKLSVACNRGLITVQIDGQLSGKIADATFPDGLIGFALFGPGSADFSDLRVQGLQ